MTEVVHQLQMVPHTDYLLRPGGMRSEITAGVVPQQAILRGTAICHD